jgi:hypothetical protein
VRLEQRGARDGHRIGLARGDHGLGLLRFGDEADREDRHVDLGLDALGQRHLVARRQQDLLLRRDATGGHMHEVAAARRECLREGDAALDIPAALDPVGGREAHAHRHRRRHRGTHRLGHLEREAHAVLERTAVAVGALVGQRREELMQQVAMRAVQLDGVDAQRLRALRGLHEGRLHAQQAGGVERQWCRLAGRMRQGRRRHRLPRALVRPERLAAFPRDVARRLAPGVAELDRDGHARVAADRLQHARHRGLGRVVVQTHVLRRDAADGLDRRGLDDQQARARQRELAEMDQMPVDHAAVLGGVLAHGGDHDAVGQRQGADLQRGEEQWGEGRTHDVLGSGLRARTMPSCAVDATSCPSRV